MSDSDSDLLTNNVFASQNESTTVSVRGPNVNVSNLTGISFRNKVLTSTMQMPRNYEWQRGAQSNYDQRSVIYRRETSPMSIASACDARQRHFNSSYYARGMSSQRSVYNGRGGSPMSTRSIDSNVSAADIAMAFKNKQFNKYDMRIIIDAYNKFMKQKARKRIEKRRNLRQFLKGYRRKSGYDSGELGSDSSISSDDNRSIRTTNYKNNMSSNRSTRTDFADIRKTVKDCNMFTDCTDHFRQKRMHRVLGGPTEHTSSRASVSSFRSMTENPTKVMPAQAIINNTQRHCAMTQRDRFRNGFLLLSERFNRSVAASSVPEETVEKNHTEISKQHTKSINKDHHIATKSPEDLNSDEEIFTEITAVEKPTMNQRKRSVNSDDDLLPNYKRPRVASPCKNMTEAYKQSAIHKSVHQDFEFAKPAFPVRKAANSKTKEKLISKSANMNTADMLTSKSVSLSDSIVQTQPLNQTNRVSQLEMVNHNEEIEKEDNAEQSAVSQNTTNISMQPSFKKRKLFSQNMDVTENKNTDILAANSPQDIYGAIWKEKNKARKLVTSQYCLSRDLQKDENNLLDLIHKIVPAERMNATNQTNKTVTQINKSEETDDKWDITSIISTNNNDNVSDTFTDEETIIAEGNKVTSPKVPTNISKVPPEAIVTQKVLIEKNGSGTPKKTVQKCVKTFWDTDYESDAEFVSLSSKTAVKLPYQNMECKENHVTGNNKQPGVLKSKFQGFSSMFQSHKQTLGSNVTLLNNTTESISKFNNTSRGFKLYSHRNTKPNLKTREDAQPHLEPQIGKTSQIKSHPELQVTNKEQQIKKQEKTEVMSPSKKRSKKEKSLVTPKAAKEKDISKKNCITHKNDDYVKTQTNHNTSTAKIKPQDNKINSKENKSQDKNKTNATNKEIDGKKNTLKKKNESKNSSKALDNKKSGTASKQNKISDSKKVKEKIAESVNLASEPANKKKSHNSRVNKTNISRLNSSITNNNISIRPVRSCRNSKQNVTLNTSKSNKTHSKSLRSRDVSLTSLDNIPHNTKSVQNKKTKIQKQEQSVSSDISFSLPQDKITNKKPVSSLNTRVLRTRELDTSDVSFSLTYDKDSSLPKRNTRGNSAKARNNSTMNPCICLTPLKVSLNLKDFCSSKNEVRVLRNKVTK